MIDVFDVVAYIFSCNISISIMFIMLFTPYYMFGCSEVVDGYIENITKKTPKYFRYYDEFYDLCDYEVHLGEYIYNISNKRCPSNEMYYKHKWPVKVTYNHYFKNKTCIDITVENDKSKWWLYEYAFNNIGFSICLLLMFKLCYLLVDFGYSEITRYIYIKKAEISKKLDTATADDF